MESPATAGAGSGIHWMWCLDFELCRPTAWWHGRRDLHASHGEMQCRVVVPYGSVKGAELFFPFDQQ